MRNNAAFKRELMAIKGNVCKICGQSVLNIDPSEVHFHHFSDIKNCTIGSHKATKKQMLDEMKYVWCTCSDCHAKIHGGKIPMSSATDNRVEELRSKNEVLHDLLLDAHLELLDYKNAIIKSYMEAQ